jgi:hypothetical protein
MRCDFFKRMGRTLLRLEKYVFIDYLIGMARGSRL